MCALPFNTEIFLDVMRSPSTTSLLDHEQLWSRQPSQGLAQRRLVYLISTKEGTAKDIVGTQSIFISPTHLSNAKSMIR